MSSDPDATEAATESAELAPATPEFVEQIVEGRGAEVRSAETQAEPAYTHEHPALEEIAAEAYAIYMSGGARDGRDLEDWLDAERRLRARRGH